MRSMWLTLTLLLLLALAAFPQATGANQGVISGTVLDEHGQPFKGVQVCTWMRGAPAGSEESRGGCPATTNEAGQFRIDHVAMGTIGVEAIKPEDGYVAFAGTSVSELVTLTPNQWSATVVLKLGPKAAFVLPTVKDKFTGKPVTDFHVSWLLFDSDEPNSPSSGGQRISHGISRAIIPPEKYLVLTISARGYKKWFYSDPSDPSAATRNGSTAIRLILLDRPSFVCNRVR
jgi:hypothetical protein